MPLASGSRLGPYEIVAPLGAGGMGEVYRAWDPRLRRHVALKVIADASAGSAGQDDLPRRFEQEARAVAALSHPNVLAIFDVGVGDVPFLVTELLDGESLRAIVERGPIPAPRAIDLALQLLAGLAAAHARGIVHRDLKPENVVVTSEGQLKILDFGLARQVGAIDGGWQSTTRGRTPAGTLLGTIGYAAPEQVRGREADHRADIFASGAILYEMLTGQRAFRRESPADTIAAILNDPPSTLTFRSDTPPSLVRVVRRCLEKHPDDRFQSARDVMVALESASDVCAAREAPAGRPAETSVAVLPFANVSADADTGYFSDGLAEELIIALTRLSGLRVASRTSSFRYRGGQTDIRQIGRDLGVTALLEGSVRRAGSRLRVSAQLTNAADGYHLWSERYDREIADVFDIQDDIVASIVQALAPALQPEAGGAVRRPTENLEAYERYLKGRHFWSQRSPAVVGTAIRCFEEAIALDPSYALAYAGLADCYTMLRAYGWTPSEHGEPRAADAVRHALTLDPDLPEAHFSKALLVLHFERHWRQARRHFVDALALGPRMAMIEAYFGLFLAAEYAYGEAQRHLDRALEIDPHSAVVHMHAASVSCVVGDVAAVERHVERALDLQPEAQGPRWPLAIALAGAGRVDEAIAAGEQMVARSRAPMFTGVLGMAYALAGREADARQVALELDERQRRGEYVVPLARLALHLGLRDASGLGRSLAACVEGGAAPTSIIVLIRRLIEPYAAAPEIARLLDRLHDGARPSAHTAS